MSPGNPPGTDRPEDPAWSPGQGPRTQGGPGEFLKIPGQHADIPADRSGGAVFQVDGATTDVPSTEGHAAATKMGGAVASGMAWMIVLSFFVKVVTFIAMVVLGNVLDETAFSLYATATAIAGFVMVCREAGMRELLTQRGHREYESLAGPAFWLSLAYNTLVAVVLAALALPLSHWLNDELLAPMLWVMAAALPVGTLGNLLHVKIRIDLEFRSFSMLSGMTALTRQCSAILLALAGVGAMSFAWPVLIAAIFDTVAGFLRKPDKLWARTADVHRWPGLLRDAKWLMFGSVSNFALDWGPFLVLRPVLHVATAVNGVFFFAFNITAQIGVLLSWSLMLVLTPVLARMSDQAERFAAAALRALRVLMLAGCFASVGLAAVMDPLETLLFNNKWDEAVLPVIILGIFFPWRVTFGLTSSILLARGQFKTYAYITLLEGLGLTLATGVASQVHESADSIAIGAGAWLLISRACVTMWLYGTMGVGPRQVLGSTLPAWFVALASGALGFAADRWLGIGAPVQAELKSLGASDQVALMGASLARVILIGAIMSAAFATLCRLLLAGTLRDCLSVAPAKLRPLVARLMLMRDEPATH